MKRSKLISLVLTFSLIATTIMTGCSSESYKDTSTSTATTYESAPSSNYRTDDISYYDVTYAEDGEAAYDSSYYNATVRGGMPGEGGQGGMPGEGSQGGMGGSAGQDGNLPEQPEFNTEEYLDIKESGFKKTTVSPLSTFAADVDTGWRLLWI